MTLVQTRRRVLQLGLSIPMLGSAVSVPGCSTSRIVCERNCLSEESAQGFQSFLKGQTTTSLSFASERLIVLAGAGEVPVASIASLREQALRGAWIVWENSPICQGEGFELRRRTFGDAFGMSFHQPVAFTPDHLRSQGMYVRYSWPRATLTRTFVGVVPVTCAPTEAIAFYDKIPVAAKRRVGRGGILFLGSMLGTNVRAGEPQAIEIATEILHASLSSTAG